MLQVVNVGAVLTSSLAICPGEDRSLLVAREFDDRLRATCNGAELEQVVVALLRNAAEALPAEPASARAIRVAAWRNADERIFIEISDTGGGIAAKDFDRVFDASFTTKPEPVSEAYGLSVCQALLESWGGALYVRTTSVRGTSFRLELPCAAQGC